MSLMMRMRVREENGYYKPDFVPTTKLFRWQITYMIDAIARLNYIYYIFGIGLTSSKSAIYGVVQGFLNPTKES